MEKKKALLLDQKGIERALMRIAHEIIEKNLSLESICLVGIKRRGVPMAERIQKNIEKIEGKKVPLGVLDITWYRDDLSKESVSPMLHASSLPFDVTDKNIVLIDDVLYTGRTVRAGIEAIFSLGRPKSIALAILVDRGHRELPIRADFVGKNVPTSLKENIRVHFHEIDNEESVYIFETL